MNAYIPYLASTRPTREDIAQTWVIVPAYNEESPIGAVVRSLRAAGFVQVCVVDDGSRDDTAGIARGAGAYVLRHLINLGQGAALQTGIAYALRNGAAYVCTFDADGQHAAESITDLLHALIQARADVALGSRFLRNAAAVPPLRRLLLKGALLFTRLHANLNVTDTHNGLRVFTRRAAQAISIQQPAMAHASEILQQIHSLRLTYVEVPVNVSYTNYSKAKGQSGFDSIRILLDLLYRAMASRS
jgi:glycosyltransferase involved in cell wall biosynthesis